MGILLKKLKKCYPTLTRGFPTDLFINCRISRKPIMKELTI